MQVQLSTGVTLFLILGLTSLSVVIITITYANAQLDGFAGLVCGIGSVGASASSSGSGGGSHMTSTSMGGTITSDDLKALS